MRRVWSLYSSSVGKKILMAVSGVLLFGFVFAHMVGNLKIYQGPEKFDAYAEFLREVGSPAFGHGQMLWIARIALLGALGVHVDAAIRLTLQSRKARTKRNRRVRDQSFSYASRTMRWGGVIVAGFVVYHILHLTLGTVHPDFSDASAYRNVVRGFQVWPVALAYVACMLPLGLHLYHGLWSMTQTLALDAPRIDLIRRPAAAAIAGAIVLGNISIPISILAGWVG